MFVIHFNGSTISNDYYTNNDLNRFQTSSRYISSYPAPKVYTNSFPTASFGNPISSQSMGGDWNSQMFVIHFDGSTISNDYYTNNDLNRFQTYDRMDMGGGMVFENPPSAGTYGVDRHTTTNLAYGTSIGSATTWSTGYDTLTSGSGRYWGLESRQGGSIYYGWIQYDMSNDGKTLSFIDAAFSPTPGASISVGVVSEPTVYSDSAAIAGTYGADRHTTTNLAYGSSVGGATTWSTGNNTLTSGSGMYWGLESRQASDVYYGWMQYDMSSDGRTLTVTQAAFNDVPGESITVGVVPEPSIGALVALGLGGLGLMRRVRIPRAFSAAGGG